MDLYEFRNNLYSDTIKLAYEKNISRIAAFTEIVAGYLSDADLLSDFKPVGYKKATNRGILFQIDGYAYDEVEKSLSILISIFLGTANGAVSSTSADIAFDGAYQFVEEVLQRGTAQFGRTSAISDLAQILDDREDRLTRVKIIILTDAVYSITEEQKQRLTVNNVPIDRQIQDIRAIFDAFSADPEKLSIKVSFPERNGGNGIPCIEAFESEEGEFRSFMCVIPGNVLADIYDEYGSQLLEGNVRSFLSSKVAVNRQIQATILNEPDRFFIYNNGIAVTAKNVKTQVTERGLEIVSAESFQIINGGQTTASLSNTRYKYKADLSRIFVQMKLTELNTSDQMKMDEMVHNISKSSNSQNKVSDVDFFATHQFHIRMEKFSRGTATDGAPSTKWFYERSRGQYNQLQMKMDKVEAEQFTAENPKKQVITKTDFAKYRLSWEMHPDLVSKGAQSCFKYFADSVNMNWDKKNTIYNEDYYRETVSVAILFKYLETLVSNQSWFEGSYRANIVTYSIALFRKLVQNQFPGYDINLQQIWDNQSVPKAVSDSLQKVALYVYEEITDDGRPVINVTQWCKRVECWTSMGKCPIILPREIEDNLISNSENREIEKQARQEQKTINDLCAESKVCELGADYWKKVYAFVLQHKSVRISPDQLNALKTATRIPNSIPNHISSQKLLKLLDEIRLEGFKEE